MVRARLGIEAGPVDLLPVVARDQVDLDRAAECLLHALAVDLRLVDVGRLHPGEGEVDEDRVLCGDLHTLGGQLRYGLLKLRLGIVQAVPAVKACGGVVRAGGGVTHLEGETVGINLGLVEVPLISMVVSASSFT